MTKYYCVLPSKALYYHKDEPYNPIHKATIKTVYAEDKEKAKLYCKGKYGYEPSRIYTYDEIMREMEEKQSDDTKSQTLKKEKESEE